MHKEQGFYFLFYLFLIEKQIFFLQYILITILLPCVIPDPLYLPTHTNPYPFFAYSLENSHLKNYNKIQ